MIPNEAIEAALIAYRAYVKEWQWSIDGSEEYAMRAALSAAAPLMAEIPEGWRLVTNEPVAWRQWARVTEKSGAVKRMELLTALLPFLPDEESGHIKIALLGEPEPLYAAAPRDKDHG